ncbi:PhoH family protein [Alkalidesulfovibrio alkalitolerans DSM 16529]|uniref:PhoH-like protein n=1 Tax=Alkalidesulfovibrio alkalitolerans DSM 16529 TaxID=1121439 RepID=S7TDZ3_9BACT|nr:PhoH family protein [Alkalidesulfovibrio alkalitolerans]EPR34775.1 PhoH family protein [Alkalidesulfovibrio alkalitolerans DSM 16529]
MAEMTSRRLEFGDTRLAGELFGPHEMHLKRLSSLSGAAIHSRGSTLTLRARDKETLERVTRVLADLYERVKSGRSVTERDVDDEYGREADEESTPAGTRESPGEKPGVWRVSKKKTVAAKSPGQKEYLDAIAEADMVFGIGPAGTGKTYLAVAMAVAALSERRIKRLVLTRPAVEAGEKLGFLPGDMVEKVNPYLRPLYDALNDMLDFERVQEMLAKGSIEIAPLAFMRGRTLNDSFIILDEAQNTTPEQMKMFLTRLGFNSKAVITGDVTQIDLPGASASGLIHARRVLDGVEGIRFVTFEENDVIRHPLVGRIVKAYDRHSQTKETRR